jgi:hypothetical protein
MAIVLMAITALRMVGTGKNKQGLEKSIEKEQKHHQHLHDTPLLDKGPISRPNDLYQPLNLLMCQ